MATIAFAKAVLGGGIGWEIIHEWTRVTPSRDVDPIWPESWKHPIHTMAKDLKEFRDAKARAAACLKDPKCAKELAAKKAAAAKEAAKKGFSIRKTDFRIRFLVLVQRKTRVKICHQLNSQERLLFVLNFRWWSEGVNRKFKLVFIVENAKSASTVTFEAEAFQGVNQYAHLLFSKILVNDIHAKPTKNRLG